MEYSTHHARKPSINLLLLLDDGTTVTAQRDHAVATTFLLHAELLADFSTPHALVPTSGHV